MQFVANFEIRSDLSIVEDDKIQRESIKAMIDSKDSEIIESDSGKETIKLFSSNSFAFLL